MTPSLAHTPPIYSIPGAIKVCLLPVAALRSPAQAGRASQGPACANRKDLFLRGFYFSDKQWLLLPASDFSPASLAPSLHLALEGAWRGQAEDWESCSRWSGVPAHLHCSSLAALRCCETAFPLLGALLQAADHLCLWSQLHGHCLVSPSAKARFVHQETPALAWPQPLPPPPPLPSLCRLLEQDVIFAPEAEEVERLCSCRLRLDPYLCTVEVGP